MPNISFHQQFLSDLASSGDSRLAQRVFKKLFLDNGEFKSDRDDHKYKGIENGWIRVISRGTPGFRVIYIHSNNDVMLYRAGPHSVEDDLAAPNGNDSIPVVGVNVIEQALDSVGFTQDLKKFSAAIDSIPEKNKSSPFIKNHERRLLYEQVLGRRLLPHKEVYLVSPYLSFDLLRSTKYLGVMLDQWLIDGCTVTLITLPPTTHNLEEYNSLEARGFSIIYVKNLHAKAYLFRVDREKLNEYQQHHKDLALIGSANLTISGFNPNGDLTEIPQLELSYEVKDAEHPELELFITYLAAIGTSHDTIRNNIANHGGTPK